MRPLLFTIFLILLFAGNCFGAYQLFTAEDSFLAKFPKMTGSSYKLFRFLPLINMFSLVGIWFWQSWGIYLAIAAGIIVIVCDIYFRINYHLYVAVPSTLVLLLFIIKYYNRFK